VAEGAAHRDLDVADAGLDLAVHPPGPAAVVHDVLARLGRDREAGRDGQPDAAHLGEVGAFAAEERLHRAVAVVGAVTEAVDVLGRAGGAAGGRHGRGGPGEAGATKYPPGAYCATPESRPRRWGGPPRRGRPH